jgi:hypothetical protein
MKNKHQCLPAMDETFQSPLYTKNKHHALLAVRLWSCHTLSCPLPKQMPAALHWAEMQ